GDSAPGCRLGPRGSRRTAATRGLVSYLVAFRRLRCRAGSPATPGEGTSNIMIPGAEQYPFVSMNPAAGILGLFSLGEKRGRESIDIAMSIDSRPLSFLVGQRPQPVFAPGDQHEVQAHLGQGSQGDFFLRSSIILAVAICSPFLQRWRWGGGFFGPR